MRAKNERNDFFMEESRTKNTIVLKNLPSNLIEEAIIVFKNKKIVNEIVKDKKEKAEIKNSTNKKENYAIKEAELLVSEYITKIEEKKRNRNIEKLKHSKKYKNVKIYSILSTIIICIEAVVIIAIK
jgi:hypothetical protein